MNLFPIIITEGSLLLNTQGFFFTQGDVTPKSFINNGEISSYLVLSIFI